MLIKDTLKAQIAMLLTDMQTREQDAVQEFADRLSTMIDAYIKTATVTVPAGIPVTTAGSPTAQTGATIAPAVATIA